MDLLRIVLLLTLSFSTLNAYGTYKEDGEVEPEFYAPLENITSTRGRDVSFTCIVNNLGNYRVAWIKSDTRTILAIHNKLVTHNYRLSVTHNGHNTWKLHIVNIQKNDSGDYMCQISTNPMRSQIGYLNVTVPPDILNDDDAPSDGYQALEGGTINLKCKATGDPEPEVSWKRQDGKPIVIRSEDGKVIEIKNVVFGENLTLIKVNRSDMGPYLCLARSSVPPIRSKLFNIQVNFKPTVEVTNQLIAAPLKKNVSLHCRIEVSPRATYQWTNNRGELVMSNLRMNVTETHMEGYITIMNLEIKSLEKVDYGEYSCTSENTVGRAEGKIRLQELRLIKQTTKIVSTTSEQQATEDEEETESYNHISGAITKLPYHHHHHHHHGKKTKTAISGANKNSGIYRTDEDGNADDTIVKNEEIVSTLNPLNPLVKSAAADDGYAIKFTGGNVYYSTFGVIILQEIFLAVYFG